MVEQKKLTHAQRGRLGGLAVARKTDMARLGSHGGTATVERYGAAWMTRLALKRNGYDVKLKTEPRPVQPFPVDRPQPLPTDDVDELFSEVIARSR